MTVLFVHGAETQRAVLRSDNRITALNSAPTQRLRDQRIHILIRAFTRDMHRLHPSAKEAGCRRVQPLSDDAFDDDGFHVLYAHAKVVVFLKVGLTQFHRRHQLLAQLPHLNVRSS